MADYINTGASRSDPKSQQGAVATLFARFGELTQRLNTMSLHINTLNDRLRKMGELSGRATAAMLVMVGLPRAVRSDMAHYLAAHGNTRTPLMRGKELDEQTRVVREAAEKIGASGPPRVNAPTPAEDPNWRPPSRPIERPSAKEREKLLRLEALHTFRRQLSLDSGVDPKTVLLNLRRKNFLGKEAAERLWGAASMNPGGLSGGLRDYVQELINRENANFSKDDSGTVRWAGSAYHARIAKKRVVALGQWLEGISPQAVRGGKALTDFLKSNIHPKAGWNSWLNRNLITLPDGRQVERGPNWAMRAGHAASLPFLASASASMGVLGAGSPDAFSTLTGSFKLLAAVVGQTLIPASLKLSLYTQGLARSIYNASDATKGWISGSLKATLLISGTLVALGKVGGIVRGLGDLKNAIQDVVPGFSGLRMAVYGLAAGLGAYAFHKMSSGADTYKTALETQYSRTVPSQGAFTSADQALREGKHSAVFLEMVQSELSSQRFRQMRAYALRRSEGFVGRLNNLVGGTLIQQKGENSEAARLVEQEVGVTGKSRSDLALEYGKQDEELRGHAAGLFQRLSKLSPAEARPQFESLRRHYDEELSGGRIDAGQHAEATRIIGHYEEMVTNSGDAIRNVMGSTKADRTGEVEAVPGTMTGKVVKMMDADTYLVELPDGSRKSVRLKTADALEFDQPGGKEATAALSRMLLGQTVRLSDVGMDKKGRMLANVWTPEAGDVASTGIRRGWMFPYMDKSLSPEERARNRGMFETARSNRLGVWERFPDTIEPGRWRHGERPARPDLTDEDREKGQGALGLLMSFMTKAQPQFGSIEDAYKKVQVESLGKGPLELAVEKIQRESLSQIIDLLTKMGGDYSKAAAEFSSLHDKVPSYSPVR